MRTQELAQQIDFLTEFSKSLNEGFPILRTIEKYARNNEDKRLMEVAKRLEGGETLSEAMDNEDYESKLTNMLRAGEAAGCLDLVVPKAIEGLKSERRSILQEEYLAYDLMADMVASCVPIPEVLERTAEAFQDSDISYLLRKIHKSLSEGKTLAEAMVEEPDVFDKETLFQIYWGERELNESLSHTDELGEEERASEELNPDNFFSRVDELLGSNTESVGNSFQHNCKLSLAFRNLSKKKMEERDGKIFVPYYKRPG